MTVSRLPNNDGGIQPTILTAKGDLLTATAASTVTNLPAGSNDQVLVADSTTSTGLAWKPYGAPFAAGKNAVINGGFDIWQRGTTGTGAGYLADRWYRQSSAGTTTFARESTIVPSGSQYAMKWTQSVANAYANIIQVIETANAIQFAGKTVTLSAQVAASSSQPCTIAVSYSTTVDNTLATGGWTVITATSGGSATPSSTTYTTISGVFAIPSTAKTLLVEITTASIASGVTFYAGNCQLELGSSATTFSRAGGTLQGELAACQRYCKPLQSGIVTTGNSTTTVYGSFFFGSMRTTPSVDFVGTGTLNITDPGTSSATQSSKSITIAGVQGDSGIFLQFGNFAGLTAYRNYLFNGTNTNYVLLTAEL